MPKRKHSIYGFESFDRHSTSERRNSRRPFVENDFEIDDDFEEDFVEDGRHERNHSYSRSEKRRVNMRLYEDKEGDTEFEKVVNFVGYLFFSSAFLGIILNILGLI